VLTEIEKKGHAFIARTKSGATFEADVILSAIGRHPNTEGMGLDRAGVAVDIKGAVTVDDYLRTNIEHIYAIGDVTNRIQLTPVAIREGMAVVDTIFGGRPTRVDYADIPTAVFSQPEVGTVGLSEEKARVLYPSIDIYRTTFKPLPNRIAGREERMMMKLVVDAETDRVLGCHVVGPQAGEMAQLLGIAVKMKATKADFDSTVALHPTMAEEFVTLHRPTERYRRQAAE
jgi:glutathione reductase (NADPH)